MYIDDFLERHHGEEHARYEKMLAHQHGQGQPQNTYGNAAPLPDAGPAFPPRAATPPGSYCNHDPTCRCDLGKGGKGCLRQRIQYAYWPGWSHGEILFRLPTLYALDAQLRAQEHFFRTRDVEDTMNASMRPVPRRSGSSGMGASVGRRPVSMPSQAMRQALAEAAAAAAERAGQGQGDGVGVSRGQSLDQRRPSSRGGDGDGEPGVGVEGGGDKGGIGRGVTWHPVPKEGLGTMSGKKLL